MTNEQEVLELAQKSGIKFPEARRNYAVIDDDDYTDDNCIARFITFSEAVAYGRELLEQGCYERVSVTGWNSGILAHVTIPTGTFACPICGKEFPHYHTSEEQERLAEYRKIDAELNANRDAEIMERVKWIEEHYPSNTELQQALLKFAQAIRDQEAAKVAMLADGVLGEVAKERERQHSKWDNVFDDLKWMPGDWHAMIEDYNGWARRMACMGSMDKARNRYIQIAALAVAAVEAIDKNSELRNAKEV